MLFGLTSLLSFSFAIDRSYVIVILLFFITLTATNRFFYLLIVNATVFLYATTLYNLPEIPPEGLSGELHFKLESIEMTESHFGRQYLYKGKGTLMEAKNVPITLSIPVKKNHNRPPGNKDYFIMGVLKQTAKRNYFFSFNNKTPWIPVKNSSSLAEWRFHQKQMTKRFLLRKISDFRSAEFLSGIITGQFEDRVMRAEFGKLGLQHLMAISGFHFALLAGILAFFLRLMLPQKLTVGVLLFLMSSYFFFLGGSPSIVRAWVMSVVTLMAFLLEKRSQALNALGVSFLFVLFYDPLLIRTLGFQFSAAVTASILIFYPATKYFLDQWLIKRPLSLVKKMSSFDQHCHIILYFLREGVALATAVNIIAIPLTLYTFQRFPVMSLLFNLFIPFLVSSAMFFILLAVFFHFIIPPLAPYLFSLTSSWTHIILNFIYNTPANLNIYWIVPEAPFALLLGYLCLIFFAGIYLKPTSHLKLDFY